MNNTISEIIKPIKYLFIALTIEFVIVFTFFTALYSNYDKNLFEIELNGQKMNCYYSEKYNNGFLTNASSSGYNNTENRVNEIDLTTNTLLDIKEYEVYYKNGTRKKDTNNWLKEDNLDYKKVTDSNIQIEIKRMNKVLYKGKYINNLNEYINEKGRYYIHIYSTRKENLFTSIKTHISFNVIVGGGNRE